MKDVFDHIDGHLDANLEELFDWLRIPSISADPAHFPDCRRAAEWLAERLRKAGMSEVDLIETGGQPAVFASWTGAPGKPTVLFYGHYDVQPAAKEDGWNTEPFEPERQGDRLLGRGTADDKGQVHAHVAAVASLMEVRGSLPCNVKFIVEGEEEAGSEHTESLIRDNADRFACDAVVISDSPMFAEGAPSLCVGLRGIAVGEVTVHGPSQDLHSGSFGGGVSNPANLLAQMLGKLHDDDGRVAIDGFYDDVRELSPEQRQALEKLPFDEAKWLKTTGAPEVAGEAGYSTVERIWARPTCDVNGLVSGYTGEGVKAIVPRSATAKLSCRLVADQKPERVLNQLEAFFEKVAPSSVRVEFHKHHGGRPYLGDTSAPVFGAARQALEEAFGAKALEIREGGAIPIVATFSEVLDAPCVLMGFGLPDQNIHGPNENLRVENYQKGTRAIAAFLDHAGA